MRIPIKVKASINTYYAFRQWDNPQRPRNWKDLCLSNLNEVCKTYNIGFCAVAGTFFLAKGKQKEQISHPFLI